jgi:hypothetical protein
MGETPRNFLSDTKNILLEKKGAYLVPEYLGCCVDVVDVDQNPGSDFVAIIGSLVFAQTRVC